MNDPVVGWVVVVDGPGKGNAVKLGYGQNSIGRAKTERVSLDFGSASDSQISRSKHAILTFDPKSKKYYIQSGDSVNLTYINDRLILVPIELSGGEHILLGETTLRFVPFCGEDFDWQINS
ncbi:MAG: FHA domain-containing protein [Endozoicomonadaceae bacterium]|nr:FHA domain-containing protein [Endozoicomonadaceae bacterium]